MNDHHQEYSSLNNRIYYLNELLIQLILIELEAELMPHIKEGKDISSYSEGYLSERMNLLSRLPGIAPIKRKLSVLMKERDNLWLLSAHSQ
ncbi:TPA: hypothetical protein UOV79_002664 [Klebsiella pneumoniae]|mgnify:FL=1|uniref:hypothetical protein n=2 Tax=Klebsiella pneumoniae TaxID=573 RepID=UPI0010A8D1E1|nr:hypothetical protein [Klebsiella pneumoniae]EJC6260035.1 hypothetical protein [Klebsiella pneumoniae]EKZ5784234.1 hypothetical protein [Klebsiella pneumoniae]MBC4193435.1 hypothetical protein [Klebsiella pneumoniae]MBK2687685.1 hypothetical protein [Klebsiella pneumoniae]MCH9560184.1 hypothetical protein [Klebsiella pneumoniae]